MRPLEQWICDKCGGVIEKHDDGHIIWRTDADGRALRFRIIHHERCDDKTFPKSEHIHQFLGPDGLTFLLSFLSVGPLMRPQGATAFGVGDMEEFVDFIRRLQTPYYEDARQYFGSEHVKYTWAESNEFTPYKTESLQSIARFKGEGDAG